MAEPTGLQTCYLLTHVVCGFIQTAMTEPTGQQTCYLLTNLASGFIQTAMTEPTGQQTCYLFTNATRGLMNGNQPIQIRSPSTTSMKYPHKILVGYLFLQIDFKVFGKGSAYRVSGPEFGRKCVKNPSGRVRDKLMLF